MSKSGTLRKNEASMANGLPSAKTLLKEGWDTCHGIHGHARWRRGYKRAANQTRRFQEREMLRKVLMSSNEEEGP